MKYIKVINETNQASEPILAEYCQSFFCQLRGLMFTRNLPADRGLILVQNSDSLINSSIHMMFMYIDLAVIWINSEYTVVDTVLAHQWKLAYFPKKAAKFILETGVPHLSDFKIGDKVRFEDVL